MLAESLKSLYSVLAKPVQVECQPINSYFGYPALSAIAGRQITGPLEQNTKLLIGPR